ncbi:MAG TPA: hypothetical protein P5526_07710 [Anaerolineae bacterium]|nr:hypothetical protein [Anaerolineae bacterium]
MIDETIVKQAATRRGKTGNLFELYLWFWGRVIAALLAWLLVASLLYLYFFNPDGLAGVNYTLITTRWTDPLWGVIWRGFDWLLVVWGVVIGRQMWVCWLTSANWSQKSKDLCKAALNIVGGVIVIVAAQIIFGFAISA